jgi:predicted glutamine amidotransferase
MEDTHPYRFGQYVFCHNGTVRDFETLALEPKYSVRRKGTADSEVVFLYLLQTIEKTGDFLAGFMEGVEKMRTMDYTAMNILISDGKLLIAMREANENNDYVKKNDLCDSYYTLLLGKNSANATKFICSQRLDIPDIAWTNIPNHAVFVFNTETKEEKIIR